MKLKKTLRKVLGTAALSTALISQSDPLVKLADTDKYYQTDLKKHSQETDLFMQCIDKYSTMMEQELCLTEQCLDSLTTKVQFHDLKIDSLSKELIKTDKILYEVGRKIGIKEKIKYLPREDPCTYFE